MPGEALSLSERVQIEVGVAADESARSIAGRLGRETIDPHSRDASQRRTRRLLGGRRAHPR